ncbi:MAG: hypothetical protein ACT4QC_18670 [Planctomycetaceae bacterium]
MSRRVLWCLPTAVAFFTVGGCAIELSDLTGDEAPENPAYLDLTQRFGDALMKHDYAAAYALTSRTLKQKMTLEQFQAEHQKEWAEKTRQFQPIKCFASTGTTDRRDLNDDDYAPLAEVPAGVRRAWMAAQFALEMSGEDVTRCFDCWLLIVADGGEDKIGRFEYIWCD